MRRLRRQRTRLQWTYFQQQQQQWLFANTFGATPWYQSASTEHPGDAHGRLRQGAPDDHEAAHAHPRHDAPVDHEVADGLPRHDGHLRHGVPADHETAHGHEAAHGQPQQDIPSEPGSRITAAQGSAPARAQGEQTTRIDNLEEAFGSLFAQFDHVQETLKRWEEEDMPVFIEKCVLLNERLDNLEKKVEPRKNPPAHVPGLKVTLTGLKAKTELNGQEGTLMEFDAGKGRWQTQLATGQVVEVKPENLELCAGGEVSSEKSSVVPMSEVAPMFSDAQLNMFKAMITDETGALGKHVEQQIQQIESRLSQSTGAEVAPIFSDAQLNMLNAMITNVTEVIGKHVDQQIQQFESHLSQSTGAG